MGDNAVLGDPRWAGLYGVDADFVADDNCKICSISSDFILVGGTGRPHCTARPRRQSSRPPPFFVHRPAPSLLSLSLLRQMAESAILTLRRRAVNTAEYPLGVYET
jgi:hypothetical protein